MVMLGEPAAPRMDCEAVVGVLGWDDAWDGLGGVLGGLLMPIENAVLLWGESALPGGVGMESAVLLRGESTLPGGVGTAAAAAGEAKATCSLLDEDAGACILPWEGEPEAKEVPTPSPSCLPRGVGGAEAEGVSIPTEGGGGGAEAGDSVSADLLLLLLLPPLPDPEGLPGEQEELESLSFMGVPDMRSQVLMGPAQRVVGGTAGSESLSTSQVKHTHCKRKELNP
jgi:hypothetical protein